MKRFLLLLMVLAGLANLAFAEDTRYAEVFDTSADAGKFSIRFLWLGPQVAEDKPGDCMVLTSPDGKVMLLDAGHPMAADYVIAALDAMGVKRIDYVVASHPHIDHVGGLPAIAERYEIGTLYTSRVVYDSSAYYRAYEEAFASRGIEHVYLEDGDSFSFGESVTVDVLGPAGGIVYPDGYPKGSTQFINNHSLALKFTYGDSTALLCGDLYTGGEKELVDRHMAELDCDIMKANHHGAATSSSKAWRDAVSPQITFITSDTLEDLNIAKKLARGEQQMYHTLLDGCIRVSTPGDGTYDVLTEKDRTTTLFD